MTPSISERLDELSNELANYWYQERKYTANGRWQECKDEAKSALSQLMLEVMLEECTVNYRRVSDDACKSCMEWPSSIAKGFNDRIAELRAKVSK